MKMHEKVFSEGEKFPAAKFITRPKKLRRKCNRAKIPATKFQVAKLDSTKICTEISGGAISCGEIQRGGNFTMQNFLQ